MMRLHTAVLLMSTIATATTHATELVSLNWDHSVSVDVGPFLGVLGCSAGNARPWENDSEEFEVAEEFLDQLGCGHKVESTSTLTNLTSDFVVLTESNASNRGGSGGTSLESSLGISFKRDPIYDSIWITSSANLSARFRDNAPETDASLSGKSIAIIDTSTDRQPTRALELTVRTRSEWSDPSNLIPPILASTKIYDDTTGELLYSMDVGTEQTVSDLQTIPFGDRLGHQLRLEFSADGAFAGTPETTLFPFPGPDAFVRTRIALIIPEPSGNCLVASGLLLLVLRKRGICRDDGFLLRERSAE